MPNPPSSLSPLVMQLVAHAHGERPLVAPRAHSGFELRTPAGPDVARAEEVLPGVVIGPPLLAESSSLPALPSVGAAESELASDVPAAPEPALPPRAPIIRVGPPLITSPAPTLQVVEVAEPVGEPPRPSPPLGVGGFGEPPVRDVAKTGSEPELQPPSLARPQASRDASQRTVDQREHGDDAPRMTTPTPSLGLETPHASQLVEPKPELERENQQHEDRAVGRIRSESQPTDRRDDQRSPPIVLRSREFEDRVMPVPVERVDRASSDERDTDELVERTKVVAEPREADLQRVRFESSKPQSLQPRPPAQPTSLAPTTSSDDRDTRRTEVEPDAAERDEIEHSLPEIAVRPRDSQARSDALAPAEREAEPNARDPNSSEPEQPPSPAAKPSTPTPPPAVWPAERRAAEAIEAEPRRAVESAGARVVQVSIGRVVVRAPAPAPARAGEAAPRATPRMSLDDYLTRRNEGQR